MRKSWAYDFSLKYRAPFPDAMKKAGSPRPFFFAIRYCLRRLHRNLVALFDDAVGRVDVHQLRLVARQFDLVVGRVGGDDDEVARIR